MSIRIFSALIPFVLAAPAYAVEPCTLLTPKNATDLAVIDVAAAGGECSVQLPDGITVTSSVDEDIDACSVTKGGDNIIVIWPAASEGGFCAAPSGGINVVVVWPT